MSLLNDALKRVKRHGENQPPVRETADYPFRPIDYEKPSGTAPVLWLAGGVVALLVLSGVLFFKWVGGHNPAAPGGNSAAIPTTTSAPPRTVAQPREPQPEVALTNPGAAPLPVVSNLVTSPGTSAPPRVVTPGFANIKLQGIYYRTTSKSSALINGETVEEGDVIQEVKIKKIDRKSVTLEWHGQEKVLTLR